MSSLSGMLADTGVGLGASAVDTALSAGINQLQTNYNRKEDYKVWNKMNDKMFNQSQEAQKNAASNTVEGYRRAGLNPAVLQGEAFSPALNAAAGAPNKSPAPVGSVLSKMTEQAQLENFWAQNDFIKAQTKAQEAQAEGLEIDNENKVGERSFNVEAAKSSLINLANTAKANGDDSLSRYASSLLSSVNGTGYVTGQQLNDVLGHFNDASKYSAEKFRLNLDSALDKAKLDPETKWIYSLVKSTGEENLRNVLASTSSMLSGQTLTEKQIESFQVGVNKLRAEIGYLKKQGELTDKQIELMGKDVELRDATKANIEADTKLKGSQMDSLDVNNIDKVMQKLGYKDGDTVGEIVKGIFVLMKLMNPL